MDISENYRGSRINIFTSLLESGNSSFVIYIDDVLLTAEIDGPDLIDTVFAAMKKAKRAVDRKFN